MNALARWAFRWLVAPRVIGYRWTMTSDVASLAPEDVEVVFGVRSRLYGR